MSVKSKYLSSAFLLLSTSVIVKIIGAVYKIPLTAFIGAVGRGYFATAYNLCMPIHAITMGAFPIAISRLISKYNALGNVKMVNALKRSSSRLMLLVGLIGMCIMLALAVPYSHYVASAPKSVYTIFVLAPSILFSSMAASYRGYYEGFMNMVPTSISQTLEAGIKLVFGLVFARLSMVYLYNHFSSLGYSNEEILSLVYPFTSAFAMLGVTFGSVVSLVFVWMYYLINRPVKLTIERELMQDSKSELLSFSFPIMISCAVQSVFQFLDTATIQYSLGNIQSEYLFNAYQSSLSSQSVSTTDIHTYVYGLYSTALDFKNLVPGVTMALGVCAVPAVSSAIEMGDKYRASGLINSVYKYTMVLSLFCGIALSVFSREVLTIFYGRGSMDIVEGCSDLVSAFALTVPIYSLAGTAVFIVQAMGMPQKSIASYIVSGIIRVALNIYLVGRYDLVLMGAVISGAVGYSVLLIWNIFLVRLPFDFKNVVIKPIFIAFTSYFFAKILSKNIIFSHYFYINLLIKVSLFVLMYNILCFLCGLLKFRQIFCAIKLLKKSPKPLKNGQKYSNID